MCKVDTLTPKKYLSLWFWGIEFKELANKLSEKFDVGTI